MSAKAEELIELRERLEKYAPLYKVMKIEDNL